MRPKIKVILPGLFLMSISQAQQKEIQDFCLSEPRTVSQIADKLFLNGKKGLMSLYNYLKTQIAKTLFYIEKSGGFVFVRTNPLNFSAPSLDLILNKQNTPKTKNASGREYQRIEGLKRACPEKLEAILKLNRINKFCYYKKDSQEFIYTNMVKSEIDELFKAYCSRIRQEKIILSRAPDGNPVFSQDLAISYQTRFTSPKRQKDNIEGFRAVFNKASRRHLKGVFLTLTSKPGGSLWEVNKRTMEAWKPFNKFLSRALPSRADWIKVSEFQKNGMLHYHIILFGLNWLLHKSVIQYAWKKYGGGSILDIHAIRQEPGRGWLWSRSCPLEAATLSPGDYLSRYLEKSMSPLHGSLFWCMGIRNWTSSKSLLPEKSPKPVKESYKRYFLKGVMSALTGFRSSNRIDSLSLFSGDLNKDKGKETAKNKEKSILSSEITKAYLKFSRA